MEIYLVGGAVRDKLLGLEAKDMDYVVVGSTPEEMLSLGFKQVGCDFPVFLHPETGDEYALARTEVKNGCGYQGFDCSFGKDITLEEDLSRRDLTINAMAMDSEGNIVDPFDGKKDLHNKVLRHTTEAFGDDPVRVLRTFRFLARYGEDWVIGYDTLNLCLRIAEEEFTNLTPERVFLELQKVLREKYPHKFFSLVSCLYDGDPWFKEYRDLNGIPQREDYHPEIWTGLHTQMCLEQGVKLGLNPVEQFAVLCHDFGKASCYHERGNLHGHEGIGVPLVAAFCDRLKVPSEYRKLAVQVCKFHTHGHMAFDLKPSKIMKLFSALDVYRRKEFLESFLKCCEADARGRTGFEDRDYPQREFLRECFQASLTVDTKRVADECLVKGLTGKRVGEMIRVERINKIREVKVKWKD